VIAQHAAPPPSRHLCLFILSRDTAGAPSPRWRTWSILRLTASH
jgi:hypothetical protein